MKRFFVCKIASGMLPTPISGHDNQEEALAAAQTIATANPGVKYICAEVKFVVKPAPPVTVPFEEVVK